MTGNFFRTERDLAIESWYSWLFIIIYPRPVDSASQFHFIDEPQLTKAFFLSIRIANLVPLGTSNEIWYRKTNQYKDYS